MDPLDVLDRARADLDRRVRALADDQWDLPTPCEDWDVRELVRHLVGGNRMASLLLRGATREEAMEAMQTDLLGTDPLQAYRSSADAQAAAFREPGALERTVQHPRMDMPGAMLLQFRTSDLAVHAWDLARATGQDESMDPVVVQAIWDALQPMFPMLGQTGVFGTGPSGMVGEDAPLQHRLLDALGRRP